MSAGVTGGRHPTSRPEITVAGTLGAEEVEVASPMNGALVHTVAVLLAGGTGRRLGAAIPKQLLEVAGRPVVDRTIAAFDTSPDVDEIVVMMAPGYAREAEDIVAAGGYRKVSRILEGGASRTESTYRALTALSQPEAGSPQRRAAEQGVLLHDAVRPLVDHRIIGDCARALRTHHAVTAAVPSSDTLLDVEGESVADIPDRTRLWRAQTPQGFRLATITAAYERAIADPDFAATDDCTVVLRYLPGVAVHVVPGSEDNIKVTHAGDIALAETLLRGRSEGAARVAGKRPPAADHETARGG